MSISRMDGTSRPNEQQW